MDAMNNRWSHYTLKRLSRETESIEPIRPRSWYIKKSGWPEGDGYLSTSLDAKSPGVNGHQPRSTTSAQTSKSPSSKIRGMGTRAAQGKKNPLESHPLRRLSQRLTSTSRQAKHLYTSEYNHGNDNLIIAAKRQHMPRSLSVICKTNRLVKGIRHIVENSHHHGNEDQDFCYIHSLVDKTCGLVRIACSGVPSGSYSADKLSASLLTPEESSTNSISDNCQSTLSEVDSIADCPRITQECEPTLYSGVTNDLCMITDGGYCGDEDHLPMYSQSSGNHRLNVNGQRCDCSIYSESTESSLSLELLNETRSAKSLGWLTPGWTIVQSNGQGQAP